MVKRKLLHSGYQQQQPHYRTPVVEYNTGSSKCNPASNGDRQRTRYLYNHGNDERSSRRIRLAFLSSEQNGCARPSDLPESCKFHRCRCRWIYIANRCLGNYQRLLQSMRRVPSLICCQSRDLLRCKWRSNGQSFDILTIADRLNYYNQEPGVSFADYPLGFKGVPTVELKYRILEDTGRRAWGRS